MARPSRRRRATTITAMTTTTTTATVTTMAMATRRGEAHGPAAPMPAGAAPALRRLRRDFLPFRAANGPDAGTGAIGTPGLGTGHQRHVAARSIAVRPR